VAESVPQVEGLSDQLAPPLLRSFAIVTVSACVAPSFRAAGGADNVTTIVGLIVMTGVVWDLEGSVAEVAVTCVVHCAAGALGGM
jgi:hypothetical protein